MAGVESLDGRQGQRRSFPMFRRSGLRQGRRPRCLAVVAIVLGLVAALPLAREARAAGGDLLWEGFDAGAGSVEAIAAQPGRLFAGGSGRDWTLTAYDSGTGRVLWRDRYDPAGGVQDGVGAVSAHGDRVFAAGAASAFSGGLAFLVRAYDSLNGALLWQDLYRSQGGGAWASAMVAVGSRVIVAGEVFDAGFNHDLLVRAYDGRTGALLWQDRYDSGGNFDGAYAVAASANRVFVAGISGSFENPDMLVRAYNATNGDLLWHDRYDLSGRYDWANDVAVYGDRVSVAARATDAADHMGFLVRTYDATSGRLAWQDFVPNGEARAITRSGRRVIAAGYGAGAGILVRAYDAVTGALQWQHSNTGESGSAEAIAASGGLVFVGGETFTIDPYGEDVTTLVVQAYDVATGRLVWAKQRDGGSFYTYIFAAAAYGGLVFTGGTVDGGLLVDAWEAR